jgi:hypothetical protein
VFVPFRKEIDFFNYNYDRGTNWYFNFYANAPKDKICFDISPAYFLSTSAIKRMKEFNPNMKVILAVRDPVEFALSAYAHIKVFHPHMPSFEDFMEHPFHPNGKDKFPFKIKDNGILHMINRYRETFGDHLLLYSFDLFKRDPLYILQVIEIFTGLQPYFNENNVKNVLINTASRRNNHVLSWLMRNENVISLLRCFPEKSIRFFRGILDQKLAKNKEGTNIKNYSSEENIKLAERILAEQREIIREIFSDKEIQLGSGKPFP